MLSYNAYGLKKQTTTSFLHRRLLTGVLYIGTFTVVVLYWRQPFTALALLIGLSIVLNAVTGWKLIKMYVVCAVLGPISEIICIRAGAWHYGHPQFLGIPIWLPFVWGNASILFFELAEQFGHIKIVSVAQRRSAKRR